MDWLPLASLFLLTRVAPVSLGSDRDSVATRIRAVLDGAAFDGQSVNEGQAQRLIQQGEHVLDQAALLAS